MSIPFVDLTGQYRLLQEEILDKVKSVLSSGQFIGGSFLQEFEERAAEYCGTRYAVCVNSGTDALLLPLRAAGIQSGDEVITVSHSFFATAEAIVLAGALPVFVDIQEPYYNIDPSLIENAITPKTKALIPVHLYGQTADMDQIRPLAEKHGLFLLEDACQAIGAEYKGRKAGSLGDAAAFSFYPAKNLGAFGEGGMVTTNDEGLAKEIRILRDHGSEKKYYHNSFGYNSRFDALQAAILAVKLPYLEGWNQARRQRAKDYAAALAGLPLTLPVEAEGCKHIYHLYVIRTEQREGLMQHLAEQGIGTGIHYPVPIHRQQAFAGWDMPSLPVTEKVVGEILSLPMFPEMTTEQVAVVAGAIRDWTVRVGRG